MPHPLLGLALLILLECGYWNFLTGEYCACIFWIGLWQQEVINHFPKHVFYYYYYENTVILVYE